MVVFTLGCSSDDGGGASVGAFAGGWSNEAENRYVCIAGDGRMWLGDSMSELDGPNPCTVDADGAEFHCSASDGQDAFDGSIDATGNQLTLEVAPCSAEASECRATYARDSSLTCG
jgi:hypothetical protein